jgi:hypothetical protein
LAEILEEHRRGLHYRLNDEMRGSSAAGHDTTPYSVRHLVQPHSSVWDDLKGLFAQSWWTRVWVIQEVAMSSNCIAKCGDRETQIVNLFAAATYAYYSLHSNKKEGTLWFWNDMYIRMFREPPNSAYRVSSSRGTNLANLLSATRGFDAGNHRDKIFALLGMSKEVLTPWELPPVEGTGGHPQTIRLSFPDGLSNLLFGRDRQINEIMETALIPNYRKSTEDIYRDTTRFLILRYHMLNILSNVYHSPDRSTLNNVNYPSWVPVFHNPTESSPFGSAAWYLAGLCDYYRQYLSIDHHHRLHRRTQDLNVLSLDGFRVDRVMKASRVVDYDASEPLLMDDIWQDIFGYPMRPIARRDGERIRRLEDFAAAPMAGLPFSRPYPKVAMISGQAG